MDEGQARSYANAHNCLEMSLKMSGALKDFERATKHTPTTVPGLTLWNKCYALERLCFFYLTNHFSLLSDLCRSPREQQNQLPKRLTTDTTEVRYI